jgi:hypothetical protein
MHEKRANSKDLILYLYVWTFVDKCGLSTNVLDSPRHSVTVTGTGSVNLIMNGYTKLFRHILVSTIWQESLETKVLWITMLAMKDADGKVIASIPGLAKTAGISIEKAIEGLKKFKSEDEYSTTKTKGGKRIEEIEGGWFIINHFKYLEELSLEDRRSYWAMKKREARARANHLSRKIKKREIEHMDRVHESLQEKAEIQ